MHPDDNDAPIFLFLLVPLLFLLAILMTGCDGMPPTQPEPEPFNGCVIKERAVPDSYLLEIYWDCPPGVTPY